jgi:hypothetical protein
MDETIPERDKPQTLNDGKPELQKNLEPLSSSFLREDVGRGKSSLCGERENAGSLPLIAILSLIQSPAFGEQTVRNLAGTSPLAHQLKAVSDLWQQLGCPDNIFWRGTTVFYNRIADAPESQKGQPLLNQTPNLSQSPDVIGNAILHRRSQPLLPFHQCSACSCPILLDRSSMIDKNLLLLTNCEWDYLRGFFGLSGRQSKSSFGRSDAIGGFGGGAFLVSGFKKSRAYSFRICCALAGNLA